MRCSFANTKRYELMHLLSTISWYYRGWGGQAAADMYKGPILRTLKKQRGIKPSYLLCEDNDPSGYKSGKGLAAKKAVGIRTVTWPRYSPDLMPLDFSLWKNIEKRMDACAPKDRESLAKFKLRLRRVALTTPTSTVRKTVLAMKTRAQEIYDASGGHIKSD